MRLLCLACSAALAEEAEPENPSNPLSKGRNTDLDRPSAGLVTSDQSTIAELYQELQQSAE